MCHSLQRFNSNIHLSQKKKKNQIFIYKVIKVHQSHLLSHQIVKFR